MTTEKPDWQRLQKALTIEAEQGFGDLMGRQYRFSEFLCLTFGKFPASMPTEERDRWQELAANFADYPNLETEARQSLVAQTRRYIHQLQQQEAGGEVEQTPSQPKTPKVKIINPKSPIVSDSIESPGLAKTSISGLSMVLPYLLSLTSPQAAITVPAAY